VKIVNARPPEIAAAWERGKTLDLEAVITELGET
jgi:ABC-type taurine transport system substrate-binding protein